MDAPNTSPDMLKSVAAAVRAWQQKGGAKAVIDKTTVLSMIDNTRLSIAGLEELQNNPELRSYVGNRLSTLSGGPSGPGTKQARDIYRQFLKDLGGGPAFNEEHRSPLSALMVALGEITEDQSKISDNLQKLFGSEKITGTNIRLSHALVLGYLLVTDRVVEWIGLLIQLVENQDTTIPKWIGRRLTEDVGLVADFCRIVYHRINNADIMTEVAKIKAAGDDRFIVTDDQDIGDYGTGTDVSGALSMGAMGFGIRNPFLMIGDLISRFFRARYERNKNMQQWLKTKISLLELQRQRVEESDPRYKQYQEALDYYSNEMNRLQQRIDSYERNLEDPSAQ